ncbi:hypothetical protein [Saccharopolyspora phatthalungensis]|uniref:Uncharacterized protein n=1 Tax=Saccharopolyspora phatthalungensis TaxID=664693 RepID=A0A840QHH7_9PSEU|nr:hypothetical protein [Saccharopolyspora phatthalungensis]MBB5159621.1 hypothetical protein [Saccharopolyspora phatthalungensis]
MHEAIAELRTFPWDCDEELVTLGPSELRTAIEKFLVGNLSAQELEDWANAVEGRDDIDFAPEEMTDLVAEIANPLLFEAITPESMTNLANRLSVLATACRHLTIEEGQQALAAATQGSGQEEVQQAQGLLGEAMQTLSGVQGTINASTHAAEAHASWL